MTMPGNTFVSNLLLYILSYTAVGIILCITTHAKSIAKLLNEIIKSGIENERMQGNQQDTQ